MPKCRGCGVRKSSSWRRGWCSRCHSSRRRAARVKLEARLRKFVWAMRLVGCCKCPEGDPACLDYHHVDPAQKDFSIGHRTSSRGLPSLLREVAKCAVVCANCHRKHHYYRGSMVFSEPSGPEMIRRLRHAVCEGAITEREFTELLTKLREDSL